MSEESFFFLVPAFRKTFRLILSACDVIIFDTAENE